MDRSEGERRPKRPDTSPRRRETARCEQERRDKKIVYKNIFI